MLRLFVVSSMRFWGGGVGARGGVITPTTPMTRRPPTRSTTAAPTFI
jgi:hypothetical protein